MNHDQCPMCATGQRKTSQGNYDCFDCRLCKGVYIDPRLVRAPTTLDDWHHRLGAARELRDRFSVNPTIEFDGKVWCCTLEGNATQAISRFPESIPERAQKLLAALGRRTRFFGESIAVNTDTDFPLAYIPSSDGFIEYIWLLEESGHVKDVIQSSGGVSLRVTAKGHEESQRSIPLTVFISSTCYDLIDARAELASHLESLGCIVRLSDDPMRFNASNPSIDSIQICIENLRSSDVVSCLIDRRYGPRIRERSNKSATQIEVDEALEKPIPIYFFVRDRTLAEYSILNDKRTDPSEVETKWIEDKEDLVLFIREMTKLRDGEPNWRTPFTNICDLKKLVERRLRELMNRLA